MGEVLSSDIQQDALNIERSRLRAWQEGGDGRAFGEVLRSYLPTIYAMARRIAPERADDLAAEGALALVAAADRYQPQDNTPFIAYGAQVARYAMISARARQHSPVSISGRRLRDAMAGRRAVLDYMSLDGLFEAVGLDDEAAELSTATSEERALDAENYRRQRRVLAQGLRALRRDERLLIVAHCLQERADLASLAQRLGISPDHALRIEKRALQKMRNALLRDGYSPEDLRV